MKKSLTVLCLFSLLLCGCSANTSETESKTKQQEKKRKYEICGEKVKVREIYFDDEEDFRCSADNPCWDDILVQVEQISEKEEIQPTEFEHDPELTVVASEDFIFELSSGVTSYAYPAVEGGSYENRDRASYYIRVLKKGKEKDTYHFEMDEDVVRLRELVQNAIQFEYEKTSEDGVEAVVVSVADDLNGKRCTVRSKEFGSLTLFVEDLDHVIVGDTVRYKLLEDFDSVSATAEIVNLTKNDLSVSAQKEFQVLPYSYEVLSYEMTRDGIPLRADRLELEYTYNDWHFILGLLDEELPLDVYSELLETYNVDFFEENIVMYCGLASPEVEVVAVVQPLDEENYYENVVSVKKLKDKAESEGEGHMLVIAVPKEEWNGKSFDLYLYE